MKQMITLMLMAATFAISGSSFADARDKPAGVDDRNWISISEKFGFVIDEKNPFPPPTSSHQVLIAPPDAVSAELMPPAKGYFVVKTATGWRRVAMAE